MTNLYHGDNGVHEFWESEEDGAERVLIFRNHHDSRHGRPPFWMVHYGDPGYLDDIPRLKAAQRKNPLVVGMPLGGRTPQAAARRLEAQEGVKVVFNPRKVWAARGRGGRRGRFMRLVAVPEASPPPPRCEARRLDPDEDRSVSRRCELGAGHEQRQQHTARTTSGALMRW